MKVELPIQVNLSVEDCIEYLKNQDVLVEVVRCRDCIHRPIKTEVYQNGFGIEFPDWMCPYRCDDAYYNRIPQDDWFCGNGERKDDI